MKPTTIRKKQKRRDALKKWLKDRLGSWKPQQKQSPARQTKISA